MKHREQRQQTVAVVAKTECDLCGSQRKSAQSWDQQPWVVNEVTIKHQFGESSPDGGSGKELELDICPTCFTQKVLPALRELGLTRKYDPYDW